MIKQQSCCQNVNQRIFQGKTSVKMILKTTKGNILKTTNGNILKMAKILKTTYILKTTNKSYDVDRCSTIGDLVRLCL